MDTTPSVNANSVWSFPMPTLSPARNFWPRCRTRMLPAFAGCLGHILIPSLRPAESLPLFEEPPAFLVAIVRQLVSCGVRPLLLPTVVRARSDGIIALNIIFQEAVLFANKLAFANQKWFFRSRGTSYVNKRTTSTARTRGGAYVCFWLASHIMPWCLMPRRVDAVQVQRMEGYRYDESPSVNRLPPTSIWQKPPKSKQRWVLTINDTSTRQFNQPWRWIFAIWSNHLCIIGSQLSRRRLQKLFQSLHLQLEEWTAPGNLILKRAHSLSQSTWIPIATSYGPCDCLGWWTCRIWMGKQ